MKEAAATLPAAPTPDPTDANAERERGALMLLGALQREGRLVDFAEQDIASFGDADIGAAARLVHDGCRKVLRAHAPSVAIRKEDEGARVSDVRAGAEIKLIGDVTGKGPFAGILRHKGWRAQKINLPEPTKDHDAHVIAPAEIEL